MTVAVVAVRLPLSATAKSKVYQALAGAVAVVADS